MTTDASSTSPEVAPVEEARVEGSEASEAGPQPTRAATASRGAMSLTLVCCAFVASGAAALTFESLWFHQAGIVFGSSVWASSLVLSGFMAGMAFGSAWAARLGDRLHSPLRAFVLLELIVGVTGVALVYGLPLLTPLMAAASAGLERAPFALNSLRFVAAFALMVVPSTAMGMTLPFLARAARGWDSSFGRVLGLLYGLNTLGAVGGVLACELVFVASFGVHRTALIALSLNLVAAALGWLATR